MGGWALIARSGHPARRRHALAGVALAAILGGPFAGCALPPACTVKPADVEAARLAAAQAQAGGSESAAADSAEVAALEAEIARLAGQSPPRVDREPLVQRLLELKRGSGR